MTGPDNDDRGEAATWYLRRLLIQAKERGEAPADIARKANITKAQLSQIMHGRGGGMLAVVRLAEHFRLKPGELLDAALDWWPKHGRRERADYLRKQADRGSTESGEHPSQAPIKAAR